jgi:hypothetical protein
MSRQSRPRSPIHSLPTPSSDSGQSHQRCRGAGCSHHTPTHDVATAAASTPTPQPYIPLLSRRRSSPDRRSTRRKRRTRRRGVPGCESILTESEYCVTFTEGAGMCLASIAADCQVASTTAVTEDASSSPGAAGGAPHLPPKVDPYLTLDGRREESRRPGMAVTDLTVSCPCCPRSLIPDTAVRAHRDANAR